MTPRDFHKSSHTGRIKMARLFSNIISPPIMFAALGLAFALYEDPSLTGFAWAVVYGVLVSLAPIIFILYLLKNGRIKELHMSDTSERHLPYIAAIGFALFTFLIISAFNGPELLRCLTIFNIIELIALGLINLRSLISIHATGVMATFLLVGIVFSWALAWGVVFPFLLAVCYVRLYLKRHTIAQVGGGLALGVLTIWLMQVLFGCFI